MTMTPYPQANHASEHGLGQQGLVYDRLWAEWLAAGRAVPGGTWGGVVQQPRLSSLEARGAPLESFRRRLNGHDW
jgi:hypothetical protein